MTSGPSLLPLAPSTRATLSMPLRKHVMVVDDDPDCRELLAFVASTEGFETLSAANGQEALEVLASTDTLPDFIFLDLMMPDMGGEAFREHQLADPRLSTIPVAVMSASHDAPHAGARMNTAVFRKPVGIDTIRDVLRQLDE